MTVAVTDHGSGPAATDESPTAGGSAELRAARRVGGTALLAGLSIVVLGFLVLNVWSARKNQSDARHAKALTALIADPTKVTQTWTPADDGITATFVAKSPADVDDVRTYLRAERVQNLRADYSDRRFSNRPLPGRAELEYGTENMQLNVRYRDIEGGGELRWIATTKDSVILASLREWSAAVAAG